MKQSFQEQYNDSINLITHLILTKPTPVISLLAEHGVIFKGTPDKKQLINEVVELLKSGSDKFEDDLGDLLTVHIEHRGKEMLALQRSDFSSYVDVNQDDDEFWGALAKVGVGLVGSLFKGKRRRRGRRGGGGGNAAALAASQAAARRRASAQAAQAKRDMQMQMRRMREAAERRRREAAARRRREEAERRRREEAERRRRETEARREKAAADAARKKQTNMMLMAGGGIALLAIAGIFMAKSNPKPTIPYTPAQSVPIR